MKYICTAGVVHQELARRNVVLLYARTLQGSRETVLGYLLYSTNSVKAHVQKIAVRPESRRQGVARALLQVTRALLFERLCKVLRVGA